MSTLAQGKADLERASTAQKVADMLRERVLDGELAPGLRLSEEAIGGALGVSRNTLREAFRLLTRDRLLVHEHSRGVFVRSPSTEDVAGPLRGAASDRVRCAAEVARGRGGRQERGAEADRRRGQARRQQGLGEGRGGQHQVPPRRSSGWRGSKRLSEESDRLFAELMLAFRVVSDPKRLHMTYLPLNRRIVELLGERSGGPGATERLREYFDLAEADLVSQL